jgi:hypothetical protein
MFSYRQIYYSLATWLRFLTSTMSFPSISLAVIPQRRRPGYLTCIRALVKINQCLLDYSETSLYDGFPSHNLALFQPLCQLALGPGVFLGVVEDNEALHSNSHRYHHADVLYCREQRNLKLQAGRTYPRSFGALRVVLADVSAHDETCMFLRLSEGHFQYLASDLQGLLAVTHDGRRLRANRCPNRHRCGHWWLL